MKRSQQIHFRSRRGFSLTELLMCLSIISIAGLIAMRLFGQSMHVIQAGAEDPTFQLEQMGKVLRVDVWAATRIEITNGKTADITTINGTKVRWQWDQHQITRTEAAVGATDISSHRWTTPMAFTAERADHALVLRANTDQWRFTAPLLPEGSP